MPVDSISTENNFHYIQVGKTDTLVYKFGGFIEKTKATETLEVRSVFFETTPCLGSCPVIKLNIFSTGHSFYINDPLFNDDEGNYKTRVKRKNIKEIFSLVNYLNLFSLNRHYSVHATDHSSSTLTVFYTNGRAEQFTTMVCKERWAS